MASSKIAVVGLPTDRHSSHLHGSAEASPLLRAEMFSHQGNPYTELGVDLRTPDLLINACDAALNDDDEVRRYQSGAIVPSPIRSCALTESVPRFEYRTFDAHPDLYETFQGTAFTCFPIARIMEDGLAQNLVQIGIRTMSPQQQQQVNRYSVQVFAPWQLVDARAQLPKGNIYVSLDLDGLNSAYVPSVSHREPGGLTVREVLELVNLIRRTVVGAAVVEYNPRQDLGNVTASVATRFAREFIGRMASDK